MEMNNLRGRRHVKAEKESTVWTHEEEGTEVLTRLFIEVIIDTW